MHWKYETIIIDDEPNCCRTLCALLERHFPDVKISAVCNNGVEGLEAIKNFTPQIVFLDVEMPRMNGFEMLEQLRPINFHLIFTTSYDQYALKAFRFSAIDYLLKPIDKTELQDAMNKVLRKTATLLPEQLDILLQKVNRGVTNINKIALPTMEGLQLIPVDAIIHAEADDNYTNLHVRDARKIVVSLTLKQIEETLDDYPFCRVHRCYLVNLNEIEKYVKGEGGYLVMSNGKTIDVSRSRKEILLNKLLRIKS